MTNAKKAKQSGGRPRAGKKPTPKPTALAGPVAPTETPLEILNRPKAGHGGKRAGAGKPKGSKLAATIEKEALRERIRARVALRLDPLVDAQIANAEGIKYLVTRDKKTGKFLRVTEAMARHKLEVGEEIIEVWEKDPSTPAFTDLLNRTVDKPAEQMQEIQVTGTLNVVSRLQAARTRLAARTD